MHFRGYSSFVREKKLYVQKESFRVFEIGFQLSSSAEK